MTQPMRLTRPRRPPPRPRTLAGRLAVADDAERGRLRAGLAHDLAALAGAGGADPPELQLVVQVCAGASYAPLRHGRGLAWRKQGAPYATDDWPDALADGELALLLVPVPAGRVGRAIGKYPRCAAHPLFAVGAPGPGGAPDDAVLALVARWVAGRARGGAARLAPPVIEVVALGRVAERRVAGLGQTWPLPAPDGV